MRTRLRPGPSLETTGHCMEIRKCLDFSALKRPTISTLFQRPSEGVGKCDFRGRRRRQEDDGYSNNKRSNGSNTHPLKSAILISRASRSEVRHLREPDSRRREARDVARRRRESESRIRRNIFASNLPLDVQCSKFTDCTHRARRSDKAASPCRSRFVWPKGEVHSKLGVSG